MEFTFYFFPPFTPPPCNINLTKAGSSFTFIYLFILLFIDVRCERKTVITDDSKLFGLITGRLELPIIEMKKAINGAGLEEKVRAC
jgi:hypothetical protein